jgi:hypothetical protein
MISRRAEVERASGHEGENYLVLVCLYFAVRNFMRARR